MRRKDEAFEDALFNQSMGVIFEVEFFYGDSAQKEKGVYLKFSWYCIKFLCIV